MNHLKRYIKTKGLHRNGMYDVIVDMSLNDGTLVPVRSFMHEHEVMRIEFENLLEKYLMEPVNNCKNIQKMRCKKLLKIFNELMEKTIIYTMEESK